MTVDAKKLQTLFKQLNSKNIVYNKAYYKLTGSVPGAVFLSHIAYLFSEVFGGDEFYQSDEQLSDSLGFSPRTLRTAKKHTARYLTATKRGIPAKNHWTVNIELIIEDLLNMPLPKKKIKTVVTSHVENDMTVAVENDTTGNVENVSTNNKELQNNKELKNNNNSVVDKKLLEQAISRGVTEVQINNFINIYGPEKVTSQLRLLVATNGIINPIGWLTQALRKHYEPRIGGPVSIGAINNQIWSPDIYEQQCRERDKLIDPNDWREQELKSFLQQTQKG